MYLTEVDMDWRAVHQEYTIWNWTVGWRNERSIQVSSNSTKLVTSKSKDGETVMIAFGAMFFSILLQDSNIRKLERWSHISITDKNEVINTFIICHCPTKGTFPGSTYSQHLIYKAANR